MIKPMKWELKMHEARALRRQGAAILFDRIALLIACYDDVEFRAWHEAAGTNELDFLDEELSDTALTFIALRSVMTAYPNRAEWIQHNIRELIALTMAAEAEASAADKEQGPGEDKRISWKERALAAEAECDRLRCEVESMRESMRAFATAAECERLRCEVESMKESMRIFASAKCN